MIYKLKRSNLEIRLEGIIRCLKSALTKPVIEDPLHKSVIKVKMKLGMLLVLLKVIAMINGQMEVCSILTQESDRDKFKLGNKKMVLFHREETYENAVRKCEQIGMHLLSPTTKRDNHKLKQFLTRKILRNPSSYPSWRGWNLWIGATDKKTEGTFIWASTGEPMNFTSWAPEEPNGFRHENCVEIAWITRGKLVWKDCRCSIRNFFICEVLDYGLT